MSKEKWEMRYFRYATASLSLPRLRRALLSITTYRRLQSNHDGLGSRGLSASARAGRGDVTGLAARVTGLALLLRALPRDVTVLTTVVALSGATEATTTTTETARSTRGALPGDMADTTASVARFVTETGTTTETTVTTSTAETTGSSVTRLGAHSGNVTGLTASVALTTARGTAETTGTRTLRAGRRKVTFLTASVTSLVLGLRTFTAQVARETAVVAGRSLRRASGGDVALCEQNR